VQALKTETIPFLVGLLETGLEAVDNMAATKAQIVKALKAMQLSLKYGEQVRSSWSAADFFDKLADNCQPRLLLVNRIYCSK